MARRRKFSVFSLSFLDVMSCGFGAVVLIFLIINHATERDTEVINDDLLSEIRMLDYQVQNGERDLVELLESLDATEQRLDREQQRLVTTESHIDRERDRLKDVEAISQAQIESLEKLKSDIDSRTEEVSRMKALEESLDGSKVVAIEGEGNRQYLTGLRVGGEHILIALDASASMLDDTIINVLRRRNMPIERKLRAHKWQRAIRTVDWITAQLPLDSRFQLLTFNTEVQSLVTPDDDAWVEVGSSSNLREGLERLRKTVPEGGTSLEKLFLRIREMSPLPDNVYLITDSLPTQGTRAPRGATVSGRDRLELFREARVKLPNQIPVNVIMFPMEGDPFAAAAYWNLARATGGAFMAPSRDWP